MTRSRKIGDQEVWCFFGFGMSPFLLRELVSTEQILRRRIKWVVILPGSQHREMVARLDSVMEVLVLDNSRLVSQVNREVFSDYPDVGWSVFRDLDSQKFSGRLWSRDERELSARQISSVLSEFLDETKPALVLFPQPVETPLGMLLHREALRRDIKVAIPYHLRLFNRSYFSGQVRETPSTMSPMLGDWISEARRFREGFVDGRQKVDVQSMVSRGKILDEWSRRRRIQHFIKQILRDRESRRPSNLRISLYSSWFPSLWRAIQKVRRKRNSSFYDLEVSDLDEREFVFFPLQSSPESSINVPDPYFIDQLRVIDAIRYFMPSDHLLLVKEHPAAIGVRKSCFIREVLKRPGVRVVRWNTPSRELIGRASLTVSVTGTAALEAFLLGRPSLVLAPTFFSDEIGGATSLNELRGTILRKIGSVISVKEIEAGLANILSKSRNFVSVAPESMGGLTLEQSNISALVEALLEWLETQPIDN